MKEEKEIFLTDLNEKYRERMEEILKHNNPESNNKLFELDKYYNSLYEKLSEWPIKNKSMKNFSRSIIVLILPVLIPHFINVALRIYILCLVTVSSKVLFII